MKKIILCILKCFIWKKFQKDMKSVIGYNSIKKLNHDFNNLEEEIRRNNCISINNEITWESLMKGDLEKNMKYITYKHYLQTWEKLSKI